MTSNLAVFSVVEITGFKYNKDISQNGSVGLSDNQSMVHKTMPLGVST